MARVLVTEEIADSGLQKLRNAGHEVDIRLGLSPAELLEAVPGAHALIIRSATKVDAATLEAAGDMIVVGRAGIGLDNVDVVKATELGVMVVNAPVSNILSAAEQTMALLLAQARNIPQANASLKAGKWERSKWEGVELHGKTLGVVGLGKIGALVAQRALAFGMRLIAYDPFISEERARHMGVELVDLDTLLAQSDFITIHLPKNKETTNLLNAESFTKVKPGVRIINVARGGDRRRPRPGRRPRRLREGTNDRVTTLRVAVGGRGSPPRRLDVRGPRQSGRHHRRAGRIGAGGRLRALRRERVGW